MYSSDRIRSAVCCGADKTAVYFYVWQPKKGLPFCQQIATNVRAILFRQAFSKTSNSLLTVSERFLKVGVAFK